LLVLVWCGWFSRGLGDYLLLVWLEFGLYCGLFLGLLVVLVISVLGLLWFCLIIILFMIVECSLVGLDWMVGVLLVYVYLFSCCGLFGFRIGFMEMNWFVVVLYFCVFRCVRFVVVLNVLLMNFFFLI